MALGKVYLVGAGPGDPELITEKGRRILAEADLVLYDALVHDDLLQHARSDAELVFVGKRAGRASERQSAINERLVEGARAGLTVVRLKGGDPFLFGRGSEEAEVLVERGIPFEVVPGVPSPLAATAYAGLSLTHRDLSSSVAYLTATESVGEGSFEPRLVEARDRDPDARDLHGHAQARHLDGASGRPRTRAGHAGRGGAVGVVAQAAHGRRNRRHDRGTGALRRDGLALADHRR